MFCGKCGAANGNGSKFCLQCGAPLEDQGQPGLQEPDHRAELPPAAENRFISFLKKRWMIIAPAVVVILVVLLCMNSIRAALSPAYAVERATDTTFAMLEKRLENSPLRIFSVLEDCAEKGTFGMNFSYDSGYGSAVSGDISLLTDSEQNNYGLMAKLSLNGEDLDLTALMNNDRLALNSSLIDDQYYGITYSSYDEDIKKFAKAAALDEYTVDAITNIVDGFRSSTDSADADFADKYVELTKTFFKDLKPVTSSEKISVGGKTIGCKVVTKEITEDDLDILLHDLFDMFSNDNQMREYLLKNFDNMSGVFGYSDYYYYDDAGEEDATSRYETMLANMRDAIDSFKDAYSGKINMSYYISGDRLVRFALDGEPEMSGEKVSFDFSIDFGLNPEKDDIDVNVTVVDNDGYEVSLKATLESEYQSGVQTNQLKIETSDAGYDETMLLKSEWTEKTGELVLAIDAGGEEFQMEGNLKYADGGFTLVFDELIDTSLGIGSLDLTITAQKGAEIPNPEYINLDKWDADLINDLEDAAYGLFGYSDYAYYDDSDGNE